MQVDYEIELKAVTANHVVLSGFPAAHSSYLSQPKQSKLDALTPLFSMGINNDRQKCYLNFVAAAAKRKSLPNCYTIEMDKQATGIPQSFGDCTKTSGPHLCIKSNAEQQCDRSHAIYPTIAVAVATHHGT
ncbi:hypothetical protein EG68_06220 [Paragonimus skrjabini miyazakii]|uniref:Uncharacterized protein n=1 Tax=Paragonimus skrjabini miyazakii TaxID=59628 RepID=A0A8S9YPY6_9TREM|nr:hypothetical protein EG68_06220 [Paragonimus skrjabini miyazakii]